DVLGIDRYRVGLIDRLDQTRQHRRRGPGSTWNDYSRDAGRCEPPRSRLENLLTLDRGLDHAVARRMASLSSLTGYSLRATGRVRGGWAVKLASSLDGGVVLCSQRGFAPRLQPLPDAAADRVPAHLPVAGARARGNELHRFTYGIHRGVLVRDRSRSPGSRDSSNEQCYNRCSHRSSREGGTRMLYIAFIKNRPGLATDTDIVAKSRKWWNEGAKPAGLKTVGFYGALGSDTPDVLLFESSN